MAVYLGNFVILHCTMIEGKENLGADTGWSYVQLGAYYAKMIAANFDHHFVCNSAVPVLGLEVVGNVFRLARKLSVFAGMTIWVQGTQLPCPSSRGMYSQQVRLIVGQRCCEQTLIYMDNVKECMHCIIASTCASGCLHGQASNCASLSHSKHFLTARMCMSVTARAIGSSTVLPAQSHADSP